MHEKNANTTQTVAEDFLATCFSIDKFAIMRHPLWIHFMAQELKPKKMDDLAPWRWMKDGRKLFGRVVWAMLPFCLLVGLFFGYLITLNFYFVVPVALALSGIWQAMLLHVCEQAAKGVRVTFLTAIDGAKIYASLPDNIMMKQAFKRFLVSGSVCLFLFLLTLGVKATNPPVLSSLEFFFWVCHKWINVFIWSWGFQVGGVVCFTNALVRNFGVSWGGAIFLNSSARALNAVQTSKMSILFFSMLFLVIFSIPALIFLLEIYWVAVMTVAYREVFEDGNGLLEQEARQAFLSPSVLQA